MTTSVAAVRRSATVAWALLGVSTILGFAVYRLGTRGVTTIVSGLTGVEWVVLSGLTAFFVYTEGVLALERRWVPRVVGRAVQLADEPSFLLRLAGPLYGMNLVGSPASGVLRAWTGVSVIVLAVLLVRVAPDPWRGMVDFAVAAALAWGLVALLRGVPAAINEL